MFSLDQGANAPSMGVNSLETLFRGMTNALSGPSKPGAYYTPAQSARPDLTPAGGVVATVRRYTITTDRILVPNLGDRPVSAPQYLEGNVTEADLNAARCNIDYLVSMGLIVENGFVRV